MDISLKGKNALVCGSSGGIGLAIAQSLATLGASCILLARNASKLQAAVENLDTSAGQVHKFVVADFKNGAEVQTAISRIVAQQAIHILINNTGGPAAGAIIDAAEQNFIDAFNQHLICNHILVQAVLPQMKTEGYGRIINIISTSVKIPLPNLGVSNTIRGAVASWAKTMANELGVFGITVNNVLPGFTDTERLQSLIAHTADKKEVSIEIVEKEMRESVPVKRFGTATEIAAVAAFLASPAASYVNGVSIPVDGGRTGSI